MGLDPGVFGRFDLAALVQPHLKHLFVCFEQEVAPWNTLPNGTAGGRAGHYRGEGQREWRGGGDWGP